MPFPKVARVEYGKNPLVNVICQLRYPPILRIESDPPAQFQELIKQDFPNINEKYDTNYNINLTDKNKLKPDIEPATRSKNYEFISEDEIWKINLTKTYLSISTSEYKNWEDFKERFKPALDALQSIYTPQFYTRVGLRYVDVFDRRRLKLKETNWRELIEKPFLGLLAMEELDNRILNFENRCEIRLADEESSVNIRSRFVKNNKNQDLCFLVDSDFFYPKNIDNENLKDKLEFFHDRATRLIQLIATKKLHQSMEPKIIDK